MNIVAVIGHPGQKSDLLILAEKKNISIFQPDKANSSEFLEIISSLNPDLFILAGYNRILKSKLINLPSIACINLHGGRLPEYRGCAPINWQIINGEKLGGCCILFVDEGIDTGNIIAQSYYEISDSDTSTDIVEKQIPLFQEMLIKVVQDFKKGIIEGIPQNDHDSCYYTRRYPRDGIIKWEYMTAKQIYNLVRALADPYPNAFTFYGNEKLLIRKVDLIKPPIKGIPGRLSLKRENGIIVSCKDESLLITEVAFEGDKTPMNPANIFKIGTDFKSLIERK